MKNNSNNNPILWHICLCPEQQKRQGKHKNSCKILLCDLFCEEHRKTTKCNCTHSTMFFLPFIYSICLKILFFEIRHILYIRQSHFQLHGLIQNIAFIQMFKLDTNRQYNKAAIKVKISCHCCQLLFREYQNTCYSCR